MSEDSRLREQLVYHLSEHGAHISFEAAVDDFPQELAGRRVPSLAHTTWQLVYHLWIAQADILEFSRNPKHESPEYPAGYWPREESPSDPDEWEKTVAAFKEDLRSMADLIKNPANDLFTPFPHGSGQNLLREAILIIDHNSYHIGQLVDIRMLLGVPVRDW